MDGNKQVEFMLIIVAADATNKELKRIARQVLAKLRELDLTPEKGKR